MRLGRRAGGFRGSRAALCCAPDLPSTGSGEPGAPRPFGGAAEWNSAIQEIEDLCYGGGGLAGEWEGEQDTG